MAGLNKELAWQDNFTNQDSGLPYWQQFWHCWWFYWAHIPD